MEIKSSLINSDEFEFVKNSLIKASEKDNEAEFRVKALEYINDTSDEKDDKFFYDMLEFVRFLDPDVADTAFTTPDHLIYLNCPNGGDLSIGKSVRKWDFIYDHECLHQLWDTFAVGDKIKNELGEDKYNHKLLNFASDCVINDYLYYYRKKERPDNLITPEYIKEQFKVEYDRKVDTQYTLYLKMLPELEKIQKDQKYQEQPDEDESQGQGSGSGSSSGSNKGSSSGSTQKKENKTADDAQKSADEAKKAAKEAQDAADKAKEAGDKDADKKQKAADEAKKAAKEAQDAADKAKEAKDKGDKEGEEKAAKEAQDAADKAKNSADEAKGEKNNSKNKSKGNSKGPGGNETGEHEETEADLKDIKERAKEIIEKYKNKISGDFGTFISKCKKSVELNKSGLSIGVNKGMSGWNQELNHSCTAFVKKKVFQKKRQYKSTYQRVKRGSGFVNMGDPIQPGKKIVDKKLTINVAFYIDISGSMDSCIDDVWKASYVIAEGLKKKFKKESVVDEVTFKMYAFDTQMYEVPYGKKKTAGGGTLSFEELIEYIKDNTYNYLINVIITDAGFSGIDKTKTTKFIKDINGMIEFVTNEDSIEIKKMAKLYPTQLNYILADPQFKIEL